MKISLDTANIDEIRQGARLVADIVAIFQKYQFKAKVMAASIRHPLHCITAARAGAHIATVPFTVLMHMMCASPSPTRGCRGSCKTGTGPGVPSLKRPTCLLPSLPTGPKLGEKTTRQRR